MVPRLLAIFLASLLFSAGYASVGIPDTRALNGGHEKGDIAVHRTWRRLPGPRSECDPSALWDTSTSDGDPVQLATWDWAPYGRPSNRCWYGSCAGARGSRPSTSLGRSLNRDRSSSVTYSQTAWPARSSRKRPHGSSLSSSPIRCALGVVRTGRPAAGEGGHGWKVSDGRIRSFG
jgi:hypothetical protein